MRPSRMVAAGMPRIPTTRSPRLIECLVYLVADYPPTGCPESQQAKPVQYRPGLSVARLPVRRWHDSRGPARMPGDPLGDLPGRLCIMRVRRRMWPVWGGKQNRASCNEQPQVCTVNPGRMVGSPQVWIPYDAGRQVGRSWRKSGMRRPKEWAPDGLGSCTI